MITWHCVVEEGETWLWTKETAPVEGDVPRGYGWWNEVPEDVGSNEVKDSSGGNNTEKKNILTEIAGKERTCDMNEKFEVEKRRVQGEAMCNAP